MKKAVYIFTIIAGILLAGNASNVTEDLGPSGISGKIAWVDSVMRLNSDTVRVNCLGEADWIVSDTTELYRALDNLSDGDVIYITRGIYRTNRWLEINKNGVSIIGEGYNNADSVGVWIKPIDNGNVGGFKIGNTAKVKDIRIERIRFHGNAANQSNSTKRCHAFWFYDVHNSIIRNCYITNTHPQNEHHTGGSGITVNHTSSHIDILNNIIYDSGDRDIQVAGKYIHIDGNYGSNGYNRFISFDVKEEDGNFYSAGFVVCINNVGRDRSNGSIIGFSPRSISNPSDTLGHFSISNNIGLGYYRAFIKMFVDFPKDITCSISITNNIGYGTSSYHEGIIVGKYISTTNRNLRIIIENNKLHNYRKAAIRFANRDSCIIVGNQIFKGNARGIEVENAGNVIIRNNVIDSVNSCGIGIITSDGGDYRYIKIMKNDITNCGCKTIESMESSSGFGFICDSSSSTAITDSIITENKTEYGSFGIYCNDVSPTINDNKISNNLGGGIYCNNSSSPTITNNTISKNMGSGITCFNECSPTITGNTITRNINNRGGGIRCEYYSSPTINNNIITENIADSIGGGIYCYEGSSPTVDSCTISNNNGDGVYCNVSSYPVIKYNNIIDNFGYGVRNVDSSIIVNARYNWWGDPSGPYHPESNPCGLGDEVSDFVAYDPWLTKPSGTEEQKTDKKLFFISKGNPNPFMNKTQFEYEIPINSNVHIVIYNTLGAKVKMLLNGRINAGIHTITWDGRDDLGKKVPSGFYFLKFEAGNSKSTRKLLLIN